jgi:phosphopantothenoylcysteine decarboxylase / phosphopantothenate---cysteine ligase
VKVTLGVTGCIAAYKAVEVMRGLQKAGASVQVVMTRAARRFVGPLTFEALSGQPVITDLFRRDTNTTILHIRAAQSADLLAIVPATANTIAKFANGVADDALSTVYVSSPAPVLLAPAMNVEMWQHATVRANLDVLRARGHAIVEPEAGMLACGTEGEGRLAGVDVVVARCLELLRKAESLSGLRVLVTAGPTIEDIDPVRFISNRSSGRMGYAFAQAARSRGAEVHLVSGPTGLSSPPGVIVHRVRSAQEMLDAVLSLFPETDIVVKAAAVSDYRPAEILPRKAKKGAAETVLRLVATQDILERLGQRRTGQVLVGFAAETENLLACAQEKLRRKNLDLVVANDVSAGVFGEERATVHVVGSSGEVIMLQDETKLNIADKVLDAALSIHESRRAGDRIGGAEFR